MRSNHRKWSFRLRHVLEAMERIEQYVHGLDYEAFVRDPRTVDAVAWNVMVIGEAVHHVPTSVQETHPEIPWSKMRGMRNHIVHGYDQVDVETVWQTATENLAPLKAAIENIQRELDA